MTYKQELQIILLDSIIKEIEVIDPYEIITTLKSELSELKAAINEQNKRNGNL
tara:strand:+ start:332 stop:490 length:159 start_codon:yes stop_codon:yes gene_type:complete